MNEIPEQINPEASEIQLLLQGLLSRYGFDFRDYAYPSLKRRIEKVIHDENLETVSDLKNKLFKDEACMERFLLTLSINVTSFFRDSGFYRAFRKQVVPILRTYPFVRIWHAGCSTGEEAYSMAILLHEENIYEKCRIYATDMNQVVLREAETGIFSLTAMRQYSENYIKAGGKEAFSEYYTAKYGNAIFRSSLRDNIVFSQHNLTVDGSFNEFNVIFCRNVMIYFNKKLQARVHKLFYDSLCKLGFLCLGNQESINFSGYEKSYKEIKEKSKIYRRIS